jgi:hypothetical protein
MCTPVACDGSHLKWTKAYSCGSKIDWCSKFPPNLQWIWRSRLTSNIRCRKTSGKSMKVKIIVQGPVVQKSVRLTLG